MEEQATVNYQRLRDLIRADIVAGQFVGGSRLKIPELCRRYGASAIPVREALQGLSGEGLVVIEPNRGATVREVDAHFMEDMYEIRAVLEAFIVQRFVAVSPAGAIAELEAIQEAMEAAEDAGDLEARQRHDMQLHRAIVDAIDNSEAGRVVDRHNNIMNAVLSQFGQTPARMKQVRIEHRALIAALAEGDGIKAAAAISTHFANARADLSSQMRRLARKATR